VAKVASILPCSIMTSLRSDSLMPVGISCTSLPGVRPNFGRSRFSA
jgi:hypothetical protein